MLCMSCNPVQDIPEEGYLQHMKVVHGNAPQSQTIQPSVPGKPPVDPAFEQTLKEIEAFERQKKLEQSQPKPQEQVVLPNPPVPLVEKPIELTYVYTGTNNGHRVETLELDVDGKHFVIAFDPVEKKQVESREVADLNKKVEIKVDMGIEDYSKISHIEAVREFTCDICSKEFDSNRALTMHKMRVHK